jgi:putative lipoprotein
MSLSGCAREDGSGADSAPAYVSGNIVVRDGVEIPAGAEISVSLEDVSRQDAPAEILSRVEIPVDRAFPIPFEIPYDPSWIESRKSYAVRALIWVAGELRYISTTHHHVLTHGNPEAIDVLVEAVRED